MGTQSIKDIQTALQQQGFDPGEIDGVWGRQTIGAIKLFQRARNLDVDGIVGQHTLSALGIAGPGGQAATANGGAPLVWLEEARRQLGTAEAPGPASNPEILQWASDLGIRYSGDDIPWCGLFVAHCIGSTLPDERLPNNPLGARSWERFGAACEPTLGAVMVFWRESPASGKGHVGFYNGEDQHAFHILGGNQSDQVSVARVGKDRVVGARQPATTPPLAGGAFRVDAAGQPLSHREA
jgi:uncharacterized protein (TIGR02594 family)